jgi:hypothetical protein
METMNQKAPEPVKACVGRIVHFAPPQDCVGKTTLDFYAAMITQVNPDGTVELATFGPNSLYFQHAVPASMHENSPQAGCWSWPPRQ